MRILYTTISNAILTGIFFVIISALFIFVTNRPLDGFFGGRFFIIAFGIIGLIIGSFSGFIIGLINKSIFTGMLIGGGIYIIFLLLFMGRVPDKNEMLQALLFLIIPTVCATLASGITAKIFNTKNISTEI
jgi:hypothetical protein